MKAGKHDLVVIGAGPGGYVAAIRAAQLGLNSACVEMEPALGGTCLRIGCIPSKALLESSERWVELREHLPDHGIEATNARFDLAAMMQRKSRVVETLTRGVESLFRKNKITRYQGRARLAGPGQVTVDGKEPATLEARHILIATGSIPSTLPGIAPDGNRIGTSTEALSYDQVPGHLAVIGGGYIGLELGSVWRRLGAKVTVIEYLDRILAGMDREIADEAQKLFEKQGMQFRLGQKVTAAHVSGKGCVVECAGSEPLKCDRVLLAVGRRPNIDGLGLEILGVKVDSKGQISVDEQFRTSVPGIYAIGDVIGGPMLAHKAEEEGMACVEWIVKKFGHVNYDAIPGVVYTQPEIAGVGKTEEQLREAKTEFRKGTFPFRANGRAWALGATEGKVKLLADARTDRILGVHILGPRAGDLIAEAAIAIAFQASAEDIAISSHAHPTLAEAFKEAALAAAGRAIHI